MRHLITSSIRSSPKKASISLILMLARSFTSGINVLLIIPLLSLIGLQLSGNTNTVVTHGLLSIFSVAHIPLNLISVLLLFIGIISTVATIHYFDEGVRAQWHEQFQQTLRRKVYQALHHSNWQFFISKNQSELLHGLTTDLNATMICHYQCLQLVSQGMLAGIYLGLSCLLSWKLTCFAGVIALCWFSILRFSHRKTIEIGAAFIKQSQTLFQSIHEQLLGLKSIKASGAESIFLEKVVAQGELLCEQGIHAIHVQAANKWRYTVATALCFGTILWMAINPLKIPIDVLLLLLLIFSRLMPMVSSMQQNLQLLLKHLPAFKHLQEIYQECLTHQEPPAEKNTNIKPFNELRLVQIGFNYHSALPVISNVSMRLKKNTTTVLMGPSGSGKTTLADLILGLLTPTAGKLLIDEQPLRAEQRLSWRQSIAYVPQDPIFFDASIRDNLQLFTEPVSDTILWEALAKVSAKEFIEHLDNQLDTRIGSRGQHLSGGERQRLALARALLKKPQLLILDESTNALDPKNLHIIQDSLNALRGTMTILIITHQTVFSQDVDQIITIESQAKELA